MKHATTQNPTTDSNCIGSPMPLLASAPVDRIVRSVTTARNDRFTVRYADGQTLEIHARPDSSDDRIRAIAEGR